jgi:epoxyqueuosine reductase
VSNSHELTEAIRSYAFGLGFDYCRFVPVETALHADFFQLWLRQGRAGEMGYLERHIEKRRDPALLASGDAARFRSMIVLGVDYHQFDLPEAVRNDPSRGIIASYAWSDDYHEVLRPALYEIDEFIRFKSGRTTLGKCLVDTGPVLERDWAHRSGMGFTGKNCCTIHPGGGSWIFLATVLVPEYLHPDPGLEARVEAPAASPAPVAVADGLTAAENFGTWQIPVQAEVGGVESPQSPADAQSGTCGSCARCIEACPTDAFVGPFHLDPQRCISYWTIESCEAIPRRLRSLFGNRIFGCDICQEVCPWNQRLPERTPMMDALHAQRDRVALPLLEGFAEPAPYWLDEEVFRAHFRRSPILRAKRDGMLRNVCVALGNWADTAAVAALALALDDPEPLAREHAAWALGRVAEVQTDEHVVRVLADALAREEDVRVRREISDALEGV